MTERAYTLREIDDIREYCRMSLGVKIGPDAYENLVGEYLIEQATRDHMKAGTTGDQLWRGEALRRWPEDRALLAEGFLR